ncbi:unnamed protein product [Clonostachys solani]|uniref:Protein-arginine deiminase C-terminal domain-containing protein n=1 Tax=Clonostachys solani TaxID=160281 RepID=A0A9N9ZKH1_9HYPO|nr:unnamed protein product [Clonostachys solani]
MTYSPRKLAIAGLALAQTAAALSATILADVNRDGHVDVEGNSDVEGKATWTEDRGALFLANIGDTSQRCASSRDFDTCNDAEGNELRNPKYLAPLRTLPITGLSTSAVGTVKVLDEVAAAKTRIFFKSGESWSFVPSNYTFTASELEGGLELGIDARDVRRPEWDGRAQVTFTVSDGAESAEDVVALRVAPVLTHHHAQLAQKILTTLPTINWPDQSRFVQNLAKNVADAGISEPVFKFTSSTDHWTQDFFEPGYSSIPGPDGIISLRIMIRSSQAYRTAGEQVFTALRSDSVGAVQQLAPGGTRDSFGNLETIPPYTHDGKSYPAGRIIMGTSGDETPRILSFIKAQESQDPLLLDTSWLAVGHVDEFLQFLPVDSERGWVLVVDDPLAGLSLLKKASEAGHGGEKAVSRGLLEGETRQCLPTNSIDQALQLNSFESYQKQAAEFIEENIARIKNATGITDDEILRMPATFYDSYSEAWPCNYTNAQSSVATISGGPSSKAKSIIEWGTPSGTVQERQAGSTIQLVAFYPGMVNGVVLSDSQVLAPNPWGPIIDGVDILANEATKLYESVGFNVTFQDDWFSHHLLMGEVHCGSNTWREAGDIWWKS